MKYNILDLIKALVNIQITNHNIISYEKVYSKIYNRQLLHLMVD